MLDQMPPEVVTRICEHTCNTGLYSLVQVSSRCHKLAATVLFRYISLGLDDSQSAVTRWTKILDRTKLWKAPRCITVAEYYDVPSMETTSSPDTPSEPVLAVHVSNQPRREARPKLCIPSMESEDPIISGYEGLSAMTRRGAQPGQTDSEASSLIAFLRKLSSLGTLIWYSNAAPAPSLALLLRNELSECKVYLRAFSVPYGADLEHMQSLVALPNLRSIWFQHTSENRLQDLLQRVVKYPTSDLEEVRMLHGWTGASPFRGASPISWNDQDCEGLDEDQLGRLRSLQLAGYERDLRSWACCTDFSYLQHLSLDFAVTRSGLESLLALRLNSLDSLAITLDQGDSSGQYHRALETFLCSIRSPSRLRLQGSCEASHLRSILDHHSAALRTLYLVPTGRSNFSFSASTIAVIAETCKNVVELGITMRRRWNRPGEDIAVLNAIGRLPYLSDLNLIFDASDYETGPPPAMGSDPEGHIQDAFINSTIDADLAKAVFNTVVSPATRNSSKSPLNSSLKTSRLRRMSLKATGGGNFGTGSLDMSLSDVVQEVGRRWIVERPSLDCHADLEARRDKTESDREPTEGLSWNIEPIFRSVWPDKGGYWFNEWQSFSLKT